ncbi:MAG TPA: 50S ribosomal protein L17 [bacterium]|nr:50S ribosomal protein L17 [bacterium]
MRHQKKQNKLSRNLGSRKALLKSLACSLIIHEKIRTTLPKAKALKPSVEKIITRAKVNTLANRRLLIKSLGKEKVVKKLLEVVGPRYQERQGGYLRIIKLEPRRGDAAKMAIIEFV